ncbi:CorA metal ion transporter [Recurvomyces mirabilis]|uniref:CorA metal ion transporter n=1 Tax=Recurvomyces mirabilis TaxID=574656 RepID=A0AAE0TPI7_9PEZI|nr:CorA metal ion transporter [Recurvomyces mirabilis]KAK5152534.1 CorA metal ion transporter [Recurvomyces mirabilis]
METSSYASPGLSFNTFGGSSTGSLMSGGILGNAINLLGAMGDIRQAAQQNRTGGLRSVRLDDSDAEDDLAYGDSDEGTRKPRTVLSRIKDRLDSATRSRNLHREPDTRPVQRSQRGSGQSSYRSEVREPVDADGYDERHGSRPDLRRSSSSKTVDLKDLEEDVEYYEDGVRRCRKRLERASRREQRDVGHLQSLLDDVDFQEGCLATARAELKAATARTSRRAPPPPIRRQTEPVRRRTATVEPDLESFFPTTGLAGISGQMRTSQTLFADLQDLHNSDPLMRNMFNTMHSPFNMFGPAMFMENDLHHVFGMPTGQTFTSTQSNPRKPPNSTGTGPRPSRQQTSRAPSYATPPPSRPPTTLLKPAEAKQLFTMYTNRWNALSPADANIPYPTRGLQAQGLLSRDTIWAPSVATPPSTWSDEALMQANAQAFYLNVAGLIPQYSEAPGTSRIEMGYDKSRATAAQVKVLVEILKKEKGRWHSDRLGRRNNGKPGLNEALQNDERSRAIFHAVCGLMETAAA